MAKVVKIIRNGTEYAMGWGTEPNVIAVTQAEYNALSPSEKSDWKLRIIKDSPAIDLWAMILLASDSPSNVTYIWSGTQAEYDAIVSKDPNTLYFTY